MTHLVLITREHSHSAGRIIIFTLFKVIIDDFQYMPLLSLDFVGFSSFEK